MKAHQMFTNKMLFGTDHKAKNRSSKHLKLLFGIKSAYASLSNKELMKLSQGRVDPELQYEISRRAAKNGSAVKAF
jgi:hypothetical protein